MPAIRLWRFPVPKAIGKAIRDSYDRVHIPSSMRRYRRGRHAAIDLAGGLRGAPVVAVWDGTIRLRSFGAAFGRQVSLVRIDGAAAFYAHLDTVNVSEGQQVKAGRTIGTVGRSGMRRDEPHLHFEIRLRWRDWRSTVNPYPDLIRLQKVKP